MSASHTALQPDSATFAPQPGDALIVVDVQCDFLPGGALGVAGGDGVLPPLNRYIARFDECGLPVIFTRDWHPPDHCSFRPAGGPWPPHCIAGSAGAAFAPGLDVPPAAHIVSKAVTPEADAYSGFQGTGLEALLRALGCRRLFVGGLATDYCVRATVLDALAAGFSTVLLADAVRAVDAHPGDGKRAEEEMAAAGAQPLALDRLRGARP